MPCDLGTSLSTYDSQWESLHFLVILPRPLFISQKQETNHENVPDMRKDLHLRLDLLNTYPFLKGSSIPIYLIMLSPPTHHDRPSLPVPNSCPLMFPHPSRHSLEKPLQPLLHQPPFHIFHFTENSTIRHFFLSAIPPISFWTSLLPPFPILSSNLFLSCQCLIISLLSFSSILVKKESSFKSSELHPNPL